MNSASGTALPMRGATVLLIEDHSDVRELTAIMLNALGASVITADNGLDGLSKLETVAPDLILCDLFMPLMDGFAFAKRLRRNPKHRRIPLIALTALRDDRVHARTLIEGFDAHLEKPVTFEMMEGLARFLPSRRAS